MNRHRPVLYALRWCVSSVLLIVCWAVWLALSVLLAAQLWIATHRELTLPDFALRAIESRLAASQVTARFGRAIFDPTGRLLIENVRLFSPDHPTPLLTIRAAYARLDFWPLLVGDIHLHELRLTGTDLHLPAMLSPSGTDEAIVRDLDGVFHPAASDYDIALCTFRLANLAVTSHGVFHLPRAIRPRPGSLPLLDLVLQRYLTAGRKLVALRPRFEALEEPRLQLVLTPSPDRGAIIDAEFFVRAFRPATPFSVGRASARTSFPLLGEAPAALRLEVAADRFEWKGQAWAEQLRCDLVGSLVPDRFAFTPQRARLLAAGGEVMAVPFEAPLADLALTQLPRVQGELAVRVAGSGVAVDGEVNVKTGEGALHAAGMATPALLELAAARSKAKFLQGVQLGEPVPVDGRIELAPGWKPLRAEGDVVIRHAVARGVPITAASAHVMYSGRDLRITDLLLLQADNVARGSYTMDTVTRDYRFLLQGRVHPPDIDGWFKAWWPNFWKNFDFPAAAPVTDVDVVGRWGSSSYSAVFCHADANHASIRGVPFDRVRATLFYRPSLCHVFEFTNERAGRSAHGSFVVTIEPRRPGYRTLDFEADSDLDVAECARIYGPAGTEMAAPYQFSEPPTVHLTGHFEGRAAPGGPHTYANLVVSSKGQLTVRDVTVDQAKFTVDYRDGTVDLSQVEAGFAGGTVTGKARLEGPTENRVLAFDAILNGADLARVINALEGLHAKGKPPSAGGRSGRMLQRATGGRLDAAVKAQGFFRQPYSYHGEGHFIVTGKELAEIHLLGLLSEVLGKADFTSLRLDAGHANFKIEGNKLSFPQVKLTGPSAAINARGDYFLDTRTLDFNATVFPLQESGFFPTYLIGFLLTPLSAVLELKLTGPLENPSWAFVVGPMNILRLLTWPFSGGSPGAGSSGSTPSPSGQTTPSPLPPGPAAPAGKTAAPAGGNSTG
jgi:hypothetical protein